MKIRKDIVFTLILISSIVLPISQSISAENYDIDSIVKEPNNLVSGQNMTITTDFNNIYNETGSMHIFNVKLLVCQIAPEFKCEAQPILMENITDEVLPSGVAARFRGQFLVYYPNGTSVGYHILVTYLNFTTVIIPNSASFQGMTIIEPVAGEFFFDAGIVGDTPIETNASFGLLNLGLVLMISVIVYRRRNH